MDATASILQHLQLLQACGLPLNFLPSPCTLGTSRHDAGSKVTATGNGKGQE